MKLENQVTSLELSKKLKELGVKQESLYYFCLPIPILAPQGITKPLTKEYYDKFREGKTEDLNRLIDFSLVSAFTVSELGEMLPVHKNGFYVRTFRANDGDWTVQYMEGGDILKSQFGNEANARAKMLIYLLENNLLQDKEMIK